MNTPTCRACAPLPKRPCDDTSDDIGGERRYPAVGLLAALGTGILMWLFLALAIFG